MICKQERLSLGLIPQAAMQANGMAAAYEVAQNSSQQHAVANFFRFLTARHSYSTGGSNDHEYWTAPDTIGDALQASDGMC